MAEEATTTTTATETTTAAPPAQAETTQTEALLKSGADAGEGTTQVEGTQDTTQTEPKDEKAAVPEKYEFVAPEGITLDPAAVEAFTPLAKELKLTNEQAQKLVDFQASQVKTQLEAFEQQKADWVTEVKADKEFGGQKLDATLKTANAAFSKFFTKAEVDQINSMGLSNFPPLIKALSRVGKLMVEDTLATGGATEKPSTIAEAMFPDFKK